MKGVCHMFLKYVQTSEIIFPVKTRQISLFRRPSRKVVRTVINIVFGNLEEKLERPDGLEEK